MEAPIKIGQTISNFVRGRKEGVEPSFLGPQPSVLTIGLQPSYENPLRFFPWETWKSLISFFSIFPFRLNRFVRHLNDNTRKSFDSLYTPTPGVEPGFSARQANVIAVRPRGHCEDHVRTPRFP